MEIKSNSNEYYNIKDYFYDTLIFDSNLRKKLD